MHNIFLVRFPSNNRVGRHKKLSIIQSEKGRSTSGSDSGYRRWITSVLCLKSGHGWLGFPLNGVDGDFLSRWHPVFYYCYKWIGPLCSSPYMRV
jgi:hypothetical protein